MEQLEKINPEENNFKKGLNTSYLRYDSLEDFLSGVAMGLFEQSEADKIENIADLPELKREAAEKIDEVVKWWQKC